MAWPYANIVKCRGEPFFCRLYALSIRAAGPAGKCSQVRSHAVVRFFLQAESELKELRERLENAARFAEEQRHAAIQASNASRQPAQLFLPYTLAPVGSMCAREQAAFVFVQGTHVPRLCSACSQYTHAHTHTLSLPLSLAWERHSKQTDIEEHVHTHAYTHTCLQQAQQSAQAAIEARAAEAEAVENATKARAQEADAILAAAGRRQEEVLREKCQGRSRCYARAKLAPAGRRLACFLMCLYSALSKPKARGGAVREWQERSRCYSRIKLAPAGRRLACFLMCLHSALSETEARGGAVREWRERSRCYSRTKLAPAGRRLACFLMCLHPALSEPKARGGAVGLLSDAPMLSSVNQRQEEVLRGKCQGRSRCCLGRNCASVATAGPSRRGGCVFQETE
eukprot:1161902-Pelagomonas_calceolata.AAC.10